MWRVCSRHKAAVGPDKGRTEPTEGQRSGAADSGEDAKRPPGRRDEHREKMRDEVLQSDPKMSPELFIPLRLAQRGLGYGLK